MNFAVNAGGVVQRTKRGVLFVRKDGSVYEQKYIRKINKKDRAVLKRHARWERLMR